MKHSTPQASAFQALAFLTLTWICATQTASGQATAFNYQGRLADNGSPATGVYDLRFAIYDLAAGGDPVAPSQTHSAVTVSSGLFTVTLDFGANFSGGERWLEIAARTNGGGAFITLSPRQKITAAPYAITAGDVTGSVAAEQLIGTIPSARFGAGSIHSNHLAAGSIHSNLLAVGSIHSNHVAIGGIHSNHLALGAVHSNHLAVGSIHSNHFALGSIHSNHLALGSIHSNHIALGSIHSNLLALGAIHSNHLALGSIHSNHIALGSIHSNLLAVGAIHSNHFALGSIHSNHIALGSIHSNLLARGAIHSNHLALGSIHSNHIALGSIHSNLLAVGAIHSNHFALGSIHSNHIALGSIHSNLLARGAIHSNHLALGSIHSNHIALGSIHSNLLAVGAIHSNHLAVGSIHSNHIAVGSIHSNLLAVGAIHSNHLAAGSIHSNALALGSVTAAALATGSIHSNHIAIGSIHSNQLAVGSVSLNSLSTTLSGSYSTAVSNPAVAFFAYFGSDVAAVGTDKLLVGAYQDSSAFDNGGAAYLLSIGGTRLRTFLSPFPQNQEHFGYAVAAAGQDLVLIGADGSDLGALDAGAAYVFSTSGALVTTLTNPTPATSDSFGFAVAAVGTDKVLVGAYADHFGANNGGAAYLFTTNGTLLATFNNPTPWAGDRFGIAVAAVGADRVLIGADSDDSGANDAGVAHLFHISGTLLWTFTNPTPGVGDGFGYAVAGVGLDKVLIGAWADNSNGNTGGAAYLFNASGTLLTTITNPTPANGDQFGVSVATVGGEALLIGAAHDSGGGTDAGAVHLFSISGALLSTFNNPAPAVGDLFGNSMAVVGPDKVLITASQDDAGATDSGSVHLFALESVMPGLAADTVRDGAITAAKLDSTIGLWTRSGSDVYRASGNVGIGTASPQAPLQVSGNNSQLRLHDAGAGNFWSIYTENHPSGADGNLLFVPGPSGAFGFIQKTTGNYFSSSDARLKEEIQDLSGVLDRVLRLRPVSYRFKSAPEEAPRTLGLIAQEVEPLFPEVVGEQGGMKSLAYSELVPVTVGAIQELNRKMEEHGKESGIRGQESETRIQKLEAENAELKRDLEELKSLVNALNGKLAGGER